MALLKDISLEYVTMKAITEPSRFQIATKTSDLGEV